MNKLNITLRQDIKSMSHKHEKIKTNIIVLRRRNKKNLVFSSKRNKLLLNKQVQETKNKINKSKKACWE